jgi:hypothetical protein
LERQGIAAAASAADARFAFARQGHQLHSFADAMAAHAAGSQNADARENVARRREAERVAAERFQRYAAMAQQFPPRDHHDVLVHHSMLDDFAQAMVNSELGRQGLADERLDPVGT